LFPRRWCAPTRSDAQPARRHLGRPAGGDGEVAQARIDAGDKRLTLVPGRDIIGPELLADGIHPGDEGHQVLAEVIGGAVRDALDRS